MRNSNCLTISFLLCIVSLNAFAQNENKNQSIKLFPSTIQPRMRVIIDNDFSGDPDGLFELVHFLLSPSVEISAIYGSHLPQTGYVPSKTTATDGKQKIEEVLHLMNLDNAYPVYAGSNDTLLNSITPQKSDAANAIIKEAMRTDTKLPLYIVCGAGLTDLASAYLMEPKIAEHITLIWIGGPHYAGTTTASVEANQREYNLGIDQKAVQIIFNKSSIPIWQVPRSTYTQMLMPYSTMLLKVKSQGKLGAYLSNSIDSMRTLVTRFGFDIGEMYVIGDSPLVLLTALLASFGKDPASSDFIMVPCPIINDKGFYETNKNGRQIKVFTKVDAQLTFDDLYSKLALYNQLYK